MEEKYSISFNGGLTPPEDFDGKTILQIVKLFLARYKGATVTPDHMRCSYDLFFEVETSSIKLVQYSFGIKIDVGLVNSQGIFMLALGSVTPESLNILSELGKQYMEFVEAWGTSRALTVYDDFLNTV